MNTERKCNICGKDMDFWDRQQRFDMEVDVGYGSVHDGESVELHICCDCFDKLLARCVVSPVVKEWMK